MRKQRRRGCRGINAAQKAGNGRGDFVLGRAEAYIGVMIDDPMPRAPEPQDVHITRGISVAVARIMPTSG